jgi:multiple sugar transport system ATP-binding protein
MELLGDATMVTVKIKDKLVSVKADKNFRAEIGDEINFSIPSQIAICLMQKQGQDFRGDPDKTTRVDHLM